MSILAPLLRPASWRLAPGAADAPLIRLAGQALIVLSGLALLAWSLAVWHGAWVRGDLEWPAALAVLCCVVWLWQASRLWRDWSAPSHRLTLRWTGPPGPGAGAGAGVVAGTAAPGGWRVDEWGEVGVEVSLVWDWQHVLLVRLKPSHDGAPAWVWLSERIGNEVHRLRTLLCLPTSFTQTAGAGVAAVDAVEPVRPLDAIFRKVASSSRPPPGKARSMRVPSPPSLVSRELDSAGLAPPLRIEDDFPLTQFFDRDEHGADAAAISPSKGAA